MLKLCIFMGSAIVGWGGAWLGNLVGGLTGELVLGGIGSISGAFLGWRLVRDYLE